MEAVVVAVAAGWAVAAKAPAAGSAVIEAEPAAS
jgi:hypothetical protein